MRFNVFMNRVLRDLHWHVMIDDTCEKLRNMSDEEYKTLIINAGERFTRPTKKSAVRLANKLAIKYQVPFFYWNSRTKRKKNGLKRCRIIMPISKEN